jgi:hypothetical protein
MMMRGFREVGWVAAVAGTALGCYMVSLKVAAERAALEEVQERIVLAQRDIRVLQTEIGTRARLEQLESWNVKVLALSAPKAQQFLEGEFQLATLTQPKKTVDPAAPVVLAAAPAPDRTPVRERSDSEDGATARDLMQVASLRRELPDSPKKTVDKPTLVPTQPVKPAAKAASGGAPVDKPAAIIVSSTKAKAKTVAPTTKTKDSTARQ